MLRGAMGWLWGVMGCLWGAIEWLWGVYGVLCGSARVYGANLIRGGRCGGTHGGEDLHGVTVGALDGEGSDVGSDGIASDVIAGVTSSLTPTHLQQPIPGLHQQSVPTARPGLHQHLRTPRGPPLSPHIPPCPPNCPPHCPPYPPMCPPGSFIAPPSPHTPTNPPHNPSCAPITPHTPP